MQSDRQQIIVLTDFSVNSYIAIDHAVVLCKILEKELTLICIMHNNEDEALLLTKMQEMAIEKRINIHTKVLAGKPSVSLNNLIPEINAVLAILSFNIENSGSDFQPKNLLKIFRNSRIPYLFVNKAAPTENEYKKVFLPIDSRKESKEKVLWASYFARFNDAEIIVMAASVKDEYLLRQLRNNLKFIKKIFENLEIEYSIMQTAEKQNSIDDFALRHAAEDKNGIVIVLSDKSYGLIDLLKGPKILNLITNKSQIPIFCLNPRDDLYVLCD
ncbi:MAG: universal stress protein [Bacteroidetes bacterium]|nr:universal stress protein [Bacteroidota bacterium]